MSNPKVFEYAKEIGMTPLALMDKIKEWQLPVKNHMAELAPEILETIKSKLNSTEKESSAKPKKVVAKKSTVAKDSDDKPTKAEAKPPAAKSLTKSGSKPAAKSTAKKVEAAEPVAPASEAPKTNVIRRKIKDPEPILEPTPAITAVKPESDSLKASQEKLSVTSEVVSKNENLNESIKTTLAKDSVSSQVKPTIKPIEKAEPAVSDLTHESSKITAQQDVVINQTVTQASTISAAVPVQAAAPVARKKEVAIGDSGVSSSTSVASRRNIIGRMDLSRVQAPPGATNTNTGFNNRSGMTGGSGPRPAGGFGPGGSGPRPAGGFSSGPRPASAGGGRNIRAGFVAAAVIPDAPPAGFDFEAKRDLDKKARKFTGAGALTAKEKEQEALIANFNAVEFRKREMVFQPKKKSNILNRDALKTQLTTPKASKRVLKVNGTIKLGDMAEEMGLKATQIIKVLMKNGVMANINTVLDFDTVALTLPDFGWEAQNVLKTIEEIVIDQSFDVDEADIIIRPPVVTVMGHVDHGKTSLLDAIRNAKVAAGEAGGITQHIGAYSVKASDGSLITFLDTPGHEAFTAMRARGANATDIAIIVVAADDGMMPQTAEAINHAKSAGVPIIVAVNKMDKPGANPDRIKQQLTELEIVPEEWGGNTIFCEVSALKQTGIDKLLENIKLLAEVAELKANPKKLGTGSVIEAKLEKGRGAVATILVKDGHVKVGQYVVAGSMKGRVKSLINDRGEKLTEVLPGMPAEVLGLEGVPSAGDRFDVVKDEKTAEEVVQARRDIVLKAQEIQKKVSLEDLFSKVTQGEVKDLNIVLKADVQGSLEAIQGMITKLTSQEVKNKIIHSAVGGVTENDVLLAHTAKGVVIGFNVRPDSNAQAKAKQIGVDIRSYSIVYEMVDDLKKAMQGLLTAQVVEKVMGIAEVRNIFTVPKIGTIAGCFVNSGKIQRSNMLRLVRDGKIVFEGKVSSLKRFKDDVKEVSDNFECGIGIENFNDLKVGDKIEAFIKEEIARELTPMA